MTTISFLRRSPSKNIMTQWRRVCALRHYPVHILYIYMWSFTSTSCNWLWILPHDRKWRLNMSRVKFYYCLFSGLLSLAGHVFDSNVYSWITSYVTCYILLLFIFRIVVIGWTCIWFWGLFMDDVLICHLLYFTIVYFRIVVIGWTCIWFWGLFMDDVLICHVLYFTTVYVSIVVIGWTCIWNWGLFIAVICHVLYFPIVYFRIVVIGWTCIWFWGLFVGCCFCPPSECSYQSVSLYIF